MSNTHEQLRAELSALKKRLRRMQKLEAIGALAGTIAHDFSNIFTSILGYSSILQLRAKDDPSIAKAASTITSATQKASALAGKLVDIARRDKADTEPVSMNEAVRQTIAELADLGSDGTAIESDLEAAPDTINADPSKLSLALLHLGTNACDAMPEGGRLRFQTTVAEPDENLLRMNPYMVAGKHVSLTITDTGPGIAEDVEQRMFEPFFTTKDNPENLGLGLPFAQSIAKSHSGTLTFEQGADGGAQFRLMIPLAGS